MTCRFCAVRSLFFAVAFAATIAGCSDGGDDAAGAAPTASAGPDQTVPKRSIVRLDASGSSDPDTDTLSFTWSQVSGPDVVLTNTTGATTSFTAPAEEGTVVLELTASDGRSSAKDTVSVQVANHQPVADAGDDRSAPPGARIALDGSASSDPDQDNISYRWSQISGVEAPLSSTDSATPFFDAPLAGGNLVFQLIVSDGTASSLPAQVVVSVLAYNGDTISLEDHPFRRAVITTGQARDVVGAGGLAYVAAGTQGLVVVATDGVDAPRITGSTGFTGEAVGVALAGSLAYVAAEGGGLRIVDITNPEAPAQLADAATGNPIVDVAVGPGRAYVVDRAGEITVFDVANPANPTETGSARVVSGEATCITVVGTVAYVGGGAELAVVDAERAENPLRRTQLPSSGPVRAVAALDATVAFADDAGVTLLDISTLTAPVVRGSWRPRGLATGLFLAEGRLYVAIGDKATVEVVDIGDLGNAQLLGAYTTPGEPAGVFADGDVALVADGALQIIGVRSPANPSLVSDLALSGVVHAVDILSGVAYLAGPDLTIIDASQPGAPEVVAILPTDGEARDVVVAGNDVFVATSEGGLIVVDVVDRMNPRIVGGYDTLQPAVAIAVNPSVAYVASGGRIEVIDTSQRPGFTLHNSYDTGGAALDLLADADRLFVADGPGGLNILDVSNPRNPKLLAEDPTPTDARAVAKEADTVYVAGGNEGLFVFGVADASRPELLANVPTPGDALDVRVGEGFVYVTTGHGGVVQFDVADPEAPLLVGVYNAGQAATTLDLSQGLAWVIDTAAGATRSSMYALDVSSAMVGELEDHYDDASPGVVLNYGVSNLDPDLDIECLVTAGACSVISIDRTRNTASLQWELPQDPGDYELVAAVGEHRLFRLVGRDQIFVR